MTTRADAAALDAADPLARFRDEFVIADDGLCYLDGNSLGRLPKRTRAALDETIDREWGEGLVRSWHDWIDASERAGASLAGLVGAAPDEVLVCDQTSINLFKLAWAGLAHSGRSVIVGDDSNFPSDRYVLRAVAEKLGGTYREMEVDPIEGPTVADLEPVLDGDVGVVSLSLVAFKSGALADMAAIHDAARACGALVLWDLSHAAGAIPVELGAHHADLAIGCTYKYLNGGPGSPAFLYVRRDLQSKLEQPIPGWFGHDDMFAFEGAYRPADSIRRFAIGTPPVVSLRGAQAGIELTVEAGMDALRQKSLALSELLIERADERLAPLGFRLATPRDPARRGGHVSLAHDQAYGISQAMIARGIVPDFRAPDLVRIGLAPLYNGFAEVFDAVEGIADLVAQGEHEAHAKGPRGRVT